MKRSDKFYTIEEATDMLGVSEQEVMNMITVKKFPAVKVEESIKIRKEDMEKFVDSLGKIDNVDNVDMKSKVKIAEEEIENRYKVEEEFECKKIKLEGSYKELLRKKQELEEDINYLQCKYDDWKIRVKKIISEEFKLFLKKIDEEDLAESDKILQDNFDNGLDIDKNIDKKEENEKNNYGNNGGVLLIDGNVESGNDLVSEEEDYIELRKHG